MIRNSGANQFYIEKLAEIVRMGGRDSLTVIYMEVPCCSGVTEIAKEAIVGSGVNYCSKMSQLVAGRLKKLNY